MAPQAPASRTPEPRAREPQAPEPQARAPGLFVTFEGGEGAGKTTQVKALARFLEGQGKRVQLTREPGGAPGAEAIRTLLLEGTTDRWLGRTEALLLAAARYEHVTRTIRPALAQGLWVLCDRFTDSTRAYQGAGQGVDGRLLEALIEMGADGLTPDCTVLLDVPVEEGLARAGKRAAQTSEQLTRFDAREVAFHERVRACFQRLAKAEPERFLVLAASQPAQEVTAALERAFKSRYF